MNVEPVATRGAPLHTAAMPATAPRATLADRLARARQARFVGRGDELALFDAMLAGTDGRAALFVHGPGGIGKSTLLAECARRAEAARRSVVQLDARHVEASPQAFDAALADALGQPPAEAAPAWPEGLVLLIDTLEAVVPLERWLLAERLPSLPADALVVLAGRRPPGEAWRLDAGWADLAHLCALGGLADDEAEAYLAARGVAAAVRAGLRAQAQGHPLLLTMLADAATAATPPPPPLSSAWPGPPASRGAAAAPPGDDRAALLLRLAERFAAALPSPRHALALRVLVLARSTTPALLGAVVGADEASALHAWLRTLSFVTEGEHGLVPHDLVREALVEAWFAPDPAAVEALRQPLMKHLGLRCRRAGEAERQRIAHEWTYLVRGTPVFQVIRLDRMEGLHVDRLLPGEEALVQAQARSGLGPGNEAIVAHWLRRQRGGFRVARGVDGRLAGWWLLLDLAGLRDEDDEADPFVRQLRARLAGEPPLAADAVNHVVRYGLHEGAAELPSPTFDLASVAATQLWMSEPRLAWSIVTYPEPQRLEPLFDHLTRFHWHRPEPGLTVDVDGRIFGSWLRDFRREPNPLWAMDEPGRVAPAAPLGHEAFAAAVREALKHYAREDRLQASPLLGCDLLARDRSVAALRAVLADAVQAMATHPRDLKFHHALRLTWLDPGASQEKVASELQLPFNTYRYHLAKGVERVVQALWQRELMAAAAR